jgi:hypothetical protein
MPAPLGYAIAALYPASLIAGLVILRITRRRSHRV